MPAPRDRPTAWIWPIEPLRSSGLRNRRYSGPDAKPGQTLTIAESEAVTTGSRDAWLATDREVKTQVRTSNRVFYVPTEADLRIVAQRYPDSEPGNAPWARIEADLIVAGRTIEQLQGFIAPTLIGLLGVTVDSAANRPQAPDSNNQPAETNKSDKQSQKRNPNPSEFPVLDKERGTVELRGNTLEFRQRSWLLFKLLQRLVEADGRWISFGDLRSKDDVWDAAQVEDTTIRGATYRLRKYLKENKLAPLARAISTKSDGRGSYARFDAEKLSSDANPTTN